MATPPHAPQYPFPAHNSPDWEELIRVVHKTSDVSQDEAKDIVQDALISCHTSEAAPPPSKWMAWLRKAVRNKAIDHFRVRSTFLRNVGQPVQLGGAGEALSTTDQLALSVETDENLLSEVVIQALTRFWAMAPEFHRSILVLRLDGLTFQAIANTLESSRSTVHREYKHAVEALRLELEPLGLDFDIQKVETWISDYFFQLR
ncbi:MAG: hypothetical protein CMM84_18755 [Rhodothermaceae bacterium]|nr:hypothetical protein [Rhodothermaceae bacterium]MAQ95552.1 hypothetical protein [Rhodothermaceae bacterium]MBC13334.1 hypothetical protein [Rhodothermaceae bacterium]MBC15068.1 hypothetical protein [Rhodothermaceae bacterium]MBC15399.1 hypothetical protein [Rhodothermaceae bacterium]|tara:strand:+ start:137 stop:745 length:609 start_codon:yes stop_codon:yes gene_type:complete